MKGVISGVKQLAHRLAVAAGAVTLTLAVFLVLPLLKAINQAPPPELVVQSVDVANIPPPPPPPEEEKKPEPEPEKEPPKLTEEAPPLDLSQLELALNAGLSGEGLGGDFTVKLNTVAAAAENVDALFSMADLDRVPRVMYQPSPQLNDKTRAKAPGTVYIIFIVDQSGRVESPLVQKSTDPVFDGPALAAVKQWRFEPGSRNGQPVRFRMRVPITFPKAN